MVVCFRGPYDGLSGSEARGIALYLASARARLIIEGMLAQVAFKHIPLKAQRHNG